LARACGARARHRRCSSAAGPELEEIKMRSFVRNFVLAGSFAFAALACGGSDNESKTANEANQAQQAPMPPQPPPPSNPPQQPMTQPEPQKPFYGPGLEEPKTESESAMKVKEAQNLTDPEIVAIANAASTAAIRKGELAKRLGTNAMVKDYATDVVATDRGSAGRLKAMSEKAKIPPKDDDLSNKITSESHTKLEDLRSKPGKEFDKAFIDDQVRMHTEVIDVIDKQLLPSAQSQDLKAHLKDVRQKASEQLQKAQDLQSKLQSAGMTEDKTKAKPTH
jgi:putative membrane protein